MIGNLALRVTFFPFDHRAVNFLSSIDIQFTLYILFIRNSALRPDSRPEKCIFLKMIFLERETARAFWNWTIVSR